MEKNHCSLLFYKMKTRIALVCLCLVYLSVILFTLHLQHNCRGEGGHFLQQLLAIRINYRYYYAMLTLQSRFSPPTLQASRQKSNIAHGMWLL